MVVLFAGGGTLGPVTPLLAVLRQMKKLKPDLNFVWAGTPRGPERSLIEKEGLKYVDVPEAKIPRYLSLKWLTWPIDYLQARAAAEDIILEHKPVLVVSAGGFTSVPLIKAARAKNIPCAIHQLDVEPGLANSAVARLCQAVTTSFAYKKPPFMKIKSQQVATPSRFADVAVPSKQAAADYFKLDSTRLIIFVVGGGTGAQALNEAIWKILDRLLDITQVIHVTGKGKEILDNRRKTVGNSNYLMKDFLNEEEMLNAYVAADLVVSRAGMGGITDLVALKKPAILVPIPGSHQEANAFNLPFVVVEQGENFSERLLKVIKTFLEDQPARTKLAQEISKSLPIDNGISLAQRWLNIF